MKRAALWLPLLVFALFVAVVAVQLVRPGDRTTRSAMIGQPFPAVTLQPAASSRPAFVSPTPGPRLVNIFASWCAPCQAEAPSLAQLRAAGATIDGVAVRDSRADVDEFLARHGNPYRQIGADAGGRVQMAIGSSGVPETFVVDARGIIRYQHIGEVRPEHVAGLLAELRRAS